MVVIVRLPVASIVVGQKYDLRGINLSFSTSVRDCCQSWPCTSWWVFHAVPVRKRGGFDVRIFGKLVLAVPCTAWCRLILAVCTCLLVNYDSLSSAHFSVRIVSIAGWLIRSKKKDIALATPSVQIHCRSVQRHCAWRLQYRLSCCCDLFQQRTCQLKLDLFSRFVFFSDVTCSLTLLLSIAKFPGGRLPSPIKIQVNSCKCFSFFHRLSRESFSLDSLHTVRDF